MPRSGEKMEFLKLGRLSADRRGRGGRTGAPLAPNEARRAANSFARHVLDPTGPFLFIWPFIGDNWLAAAAVPVCCKCAPATK